MFTRKLRRASEAIDVLEPHEPASTLLLAPILERGLGRGVDCWLAEDHEGRPGGVLLLRRYCLDRWVCHPLVFDAAAAPALAGLADASPALAVSGPANHVDPLVSYLRRATRRVGGDFLRLPEGAFVAEHADDPRVRAADLPDLEQLLYLYQRYELEVLPPIRQWSLLRETIRRRMILVAEHERRLIGAFRLTAWSRRWAMWDELTVVPEARRHGIAWALVHRAAKETAARARRLMTQKHAGNPMAFPEEMRAESSEWAIVTCSARASSTRAHHLRRAIDGAERRLASAAVGRRARRTYSRTG